MSIWIIDLYDYDLVIKCIECGIIKRKTNFSFRNYSKKYRKKCIQFRSCKSKEWYCKNFDKLENDKKKQCFQRNKKN